MTVYSLAVDGPNSESADWFRGQGYFARFLSNVEFLASDQRRLAFNTFTTVSSVKELPSLARLISGVTQRTDVEYWLISQYRPIGRASTRKAEIYGFERDDFVRAVDNVRGDVNGVTVYAQPTRAPEDPYPFRVWVLADGTVTADLGSVAAPRNTELGDLLTDGFEPLVRRAFALRDQTQLEGIA